MTDNYNKLSSQSVPSSVTSGTLVPYSKPLVPNIPMGLNYLTMVSHLIIEQRIELFEMLIGYETKNKYVIKNQSGTEVFYAVEENNCLSRNFWGSVRPFYIHILSLKHIELLRFSRPLRCTHCCFPCCLQRCDVFTNQGEFLGSVHQNWTILCPTFNICDFTGTKILTIRGPCWKCVCCCLCWNSVNFKINSLDGYEVGKISKQWAGILQEVFTDADIFGLSFPTETDYKVRAVLLAATFLIDFMYYERRNR